MTPECSFYGLNQDNKIVLNALNAFLKQISGINPLKKNVNDSNAEILNNESVSKLLDVINEEASKFQANTCSLENIFKMLKPYG